MCISHTLFRRFIWADNILWKEDIQNHHTTVVLAGRDAIVNTKLVQKYLAEEDDWPLKTGNRDTKTWNANQLDILQFQDLDHGQVFHGMKRKVLADVVRGFDVNV